MKKRLAILMCLFALSACVRDDAGVETPTLDSTVLYKTALSQVTEDFNPTETFVPTETLPPSGTWTTAPTLDRTRPALQSPTSKTPCDIAAAGHPIDVTIPDDTVMEPGESFSKTWRLENVGSCIWTRQYAVVFFSGNSLNAHQTNYLTGEVEPGEVIDVTVDMEAPMTTGQYQSNWMLSNADGELFGIGPNGDAPFWVRIIVYPSGMGTPEPSPTVTRTPVVHLTDEAVLENADHLDLDTGEINPGDLTQTDLIYQYGGEPDHILSTMNDAVWMVYGETQPTCWDCVESAKSGDDIIFSEVPVGTYICYRSSDGLPGRLLIERFAAGQLMVSFLTWAVP
jgi:hypothetical protein